MQLWEFLVKNGSEEVVDAARDGRSILKGLESFTYVDDRGKDQGINIRHRAKEFGALLNSTELLREERKKAKANRDKYTGVSNDAASTSFSSSSSSASRYQGFGSDTYSSGYPGNVASSPSRSAPPSQREEDVPQRAYLLYLVIYTARLTCPRSPKTEEPKVADLLSFGEDGAAPSSLLRTFLSFCTTTTPY